MILPPTLSKITINGNYYDQMRVTIQIIGRAIIDGSRYLPIRNRAAALATLAAPKDYFGQVKAIFDDFVKRWRYVRDPVGRELVTRSPRQIWELVMGGRSDSPGVGLGRGAGDCDDATVAIGAQLLSIGFPVRIATMAPVGASPGNGMSHVFCQTEISGYGWVTVDPVVYPAHGFATTPNNSRLAVFDLGGRLITTAGNAVGFSGWEEEKQMNTQNEYQPLRNWRDQSGLGDYIDDGYELPDFRKVGIAGFGAYAESPGGGMMDYGELDKVLMAEVSTDHLGRAWTPIIEIAPHDWRHMRRVGVPYHGMLGLSDEGVPYYWDQQHGFFKKLFKKVRKKVRSVAQKILKKIPGGKFLLKLGKKIWAVSKKLVGPLMKFVGPLAKKLAPIAALIPGYGPAISAALATTGKIASLMTKFGVKVISKEGKIGKLKFPAGNAAKAFQSALKKEAEHAKRTGLKPKRMIGVGSRQSRRTGRRAA